MKITLLILILITSSFLAAQNNTNMKTLFEKELKAHLKLEQVINDSDSTLKIKLINHKRNQLLVIDSTKFNKPSDEDLRFSNFVPPIYASKILDAILIDSCLYIWQALEYHIYFDKIIFSNDKHFRRERYELVEMNRFHFLSFNPTFKHRIKHLDNKFFFYVEAANGHAINYFLGDYDLRLNKLYNYEHELDLSNKTPLISGNEVDFYSLDFDTEEGRSIVKEAIQSVLIRQRRLDADKEIEYLFYLDATDYDLRGTRHSRFTYFFYKDAPWSEIKMIRYWHSGCDKYCAWFIDTPLVEILISESKEQ